MTPRVAVVVGETWMVVVIVMVMMIMLPLSLRIYRSLGWIE